MKDPYVQAMAAGFEDEMKKIAVAAPAAASSGIMGALSKHKGFLLPAAVGAVGYKVLSDAEEDRRMGRQIRKQQGY